jgi:hypothetical protein
MCRSRTPSCLSMHAFAGGAQVGAARRDGLALLEALAAGGAPAAMARRATAAVAAARRSAAAADAALARAGVAAATAAGGAPAALHAAAVPADAAALHQQVGRHSCQTVTRLFNLAPRGVVHAARCGSARVRAEGACSRAGGRVPAMLGSLPQPWAYPASSGLFGLENEKLSTSMLRLTQPDVRIAGAGGAPGGRGRGRCRCPDRVRRGRGAALGAAGPLAGLCAALPPPARSGARARRQPAGSPSGQGFRSDGPQRHARARHGRQRWRAADRRRRCSCSACPVRPHCWAPSASVATRLGGLLATEQSSSRVSSGEPVCGGTALHVPCASLRRRQLLARHQSAPLPCTHLPAANACHPLVTFAT